MSKKKNLTPEQIAEKKEQQRLRKNERARQRYAQAKKAGLSRDQARSIEKTLKETPELLEEPTTELIELVTSMNKFAKWIVDEVEPEQPKEQKTKKKPKPKDDTFVQRLKNLGRFITGEPPSFEQFVKDNQHLSARQIKKRYRDIGGKISDQKADKIVRDIKGTPYNPRKATKKHGDRTTRKQRPYRFRASDKNFQFTEKQYVYLLGYEVEDKHGQVFTRYIHIPSDKEETLESLYDAVLDYWEMELDSGEDDRYIDYEILPNSIYLVHAYDLSRKGA